MEVGIGLPSMVPGTEPEQLLDWARRAEARGFSTLSSLDRLVYSNYEPFVALSAAAAVTERIRLATIVLVAPYRANAALIAKQAASLQRLSHGRFVLGAAVGIREDDYAASGVDYHTRGRRFDEMLEEWERIWSGERFGTAGTIGPQAPEGRPTLMVGGRTDPSFARVARYADGWVMGGGTPAQLAEGAVNARRAWDRVGRAGAPRTMAIAYFALGDHAVAAAERYLLAYYAFVGDVARGIAANAATDVTKVKEIVDAFDRAGCDELVLLPCDADPCQVELLADAIR